MKMKGNSRDMLQKIGTAVLVVFFICAPIAPAIAQEDTNTNSDTEHIQQGTTEGTSTENGDGEHNNKEDSSCDSESGDHSNTEHSNTSDSEHQKNCDNNNDDNNDNTHGGSNGGSSNTATIVATKIVCTNEADLPNWGANGGSPITSTTATAWVASHHSCSLAQGWSFQWGNKNAPNAGNSLVGVASAPWSSAFGPTDVHGVATTTVDSTTIAQNSYLWFREVLQDGYIPFTYDAASSTPNGDNVTAEVYCATDVKNYDNYDRIDNLAKNTTYYCVAWNVPKTTTVVPPPPPPPPADCSVTVVSDITNTVDEKAGAAAKILSFIHGGWTAVISGASWIWGDNPVADATVDTAQTFTKTFTFNGPATGARLDIATDNTYEARLNGTLIGSDTNADNFTASSQDVYTGFTGTLVNGVNTLSIKVKNLAVPGATPADNPAGLLYKMVASSSNQSCGTPTTDGGGSSNSNTYHIFGSVWNDKNINDVDDEEPSLAGWTVTITDGESIFTTTSAADGSYGFDVPAGTWTITETVPGDWSMNFPNNGHFVVTVPQVTVEAVSHSFLAYFINTAEAATLGTFGPYNFGNHYVGTPATPSTGGGSSGHSSHNHLFINGGGSSGSGTSGEVLGASDTKMPEVLGAMAPVGAPNTGEGGTSPATHPFALSFGLLGLLFGFLGLRKVVA